ncbi:HEAT repeat-containing protein 3-like [Mizuhopecten yessoensis]|uniref:HEAT repeat-containing protein 3 n=1 Tax=Mizuhopecten yessoensis TaxID=6573 RepID=A0A210Q8Q0_MIZYE|nr:HEAT repeat-containing protein 3-like [Mizuhopecten yessoensis]OWF45096.1 HEAT repeat-containing protein 3 [Mizuhopecten yessoensis]
MGKSKAKKFKANKPQPTGLPSVKDCEAALDLETVKSIASNSTIQNLIEKLTSTNEDERECGCTGIAGLVSQPQAITCLLQHNVVRILAPLILDPSIQVRHRALGALRNLSVDGGLDVCEEMVHKDVLTPLVAFFKHYPVGWVPEKPGKKQKDFNTEAFLEGTHLLWNLCEATETAVEVFNKEGLVAILLPCLQYAVYGIPLSIAVGQCLHTVSEDNPGFAQACDGGQATPQQLLNLMGEAPESAGHILLKTLATGILVNIKSAELTTAPGNLVAHILTSVSQVLDVNALDNFTATLDIRKEMTPSEDEQKDTNLTSSIKDKLQDVEHFIAAQMIGLEIAANLCCIEDTWEDMDSSESDDQIAEADLEEETMDDNLFSPLCVSSEIQGAILSNEIFSKVLKKAQPCILPGDGISLSDQQKNLVKRFEKLEVHALLCINNLVSSMELEALGGLDNLHSVWQGLVQLTATKHNGDRSDLLEAVTSAMRAVVQKLAEHESPKLLEVTGQDLQFLYEMGQHGNSSDIRVNAVRIVATFGAHFAKNKEPHPMLLNLGVFLLEVACHEGELWVVAEALDSIFDVFGEDHLNNILSEIRLLDRLRQLLPMLKAKMKANRKDLGEHLPVISTAKTNLVRFIKYKSSV